LQMREFARNPRQAESGSPQFKPSSAHWHFLLSPSSLDTLPYTHG
jgi:hypothetical protein